MKIAYITVTFPSVTETFVLREINYFEDRRLYDEVLVFAYKMPVKEWVNPENLEWMNKAIYTKKRNFFNIMAFLYFMVFNFKGICRIISIWVKEIPSLNISMIAKSIAHIFAGFGVAKNVKKKGIDHMHAHFATASTIALIAHILTGVPFSFTAHASGDIYVSSPFLFEKILRAKKIIAISEYNKKYLELISHYEVDTSKIEVVYNGVDIPILNKKVTNAPSVLFMSAAYTGFKGYGTLIKALAILKEKKIPFEFYAAGSGPLLEKIKIMVSDYKLEKEVNLLGMQSQTVVQEYLKKADVFVFPSEIYLNGIRDGMPTAITEAMSYGLPIISTYISGIPEQVINGHNGYLVEERNEKALAQKLIVLLSDVKLRNEMGRRSYEMAKFRFDINISIKKLKSMFEKTA